MCSDAAISFCKQLTQVLGFAFVAQLKVAAMPLLMIKVVVIIIIKLPN
jgi:hypothetical protein